MAKGYVRLLWLFAFGILFIYHPDPCVCQATKDSPLTEDERAELRFIARTTVEHVARGKDIPPFSISSQRLKSPRGTFVTIRKEGRLRGCIGSFACNMPLCDTVARMAMQAATRDPRFARVSKRELPFLEIEISVLGPLRSVESVEEIVVGTHGLLMIHGNHSGVLLPQVASENGWDRKTFLEHISRKAGLPKDAWKSEKSKIYIFTAEVF